MTEERLQHQSWSGRSAGADAFLMEHSKVGDSTLYPSKHGLYIFSVGLGVESASTSFSNYFKHFSLVSTVSCLQSHCLYSAFAPEIMVDLRSVQSIVVVRSLSTSAGPMGQALRVVSSGGPTRFREKMSCSQTLHAGATRLSFRSKEPSTPTLCH